MLLSESMLIERIIKGGEVNKPSFKKEIGNAADILMVGGNLRPSKYPPHFLFLPSAT